MGTFIKTKYLFLLFPICTAAFSYAEEIPYVACVIKKSSESKKESERYASTINTSLLPGEALIHPRSDFEESGAFLTLKRHRYQEVFRVSSKDGAFILSGKPCIACEPILIEGICNFPKLKGPL